MNFLKNRLKGTKYFNLFIKKDFYIAYTMYKVGYQTLREKIRQTVFLAAELFANFGPIIPTSGRTWYISVFFIIPFCNSNK